MNDKIYSYAALAKFIRTKCGASTANMNKSELRDAAIYILSVQQYVDFTNLNIAH